MLGFPALRAGITRPVVDMSILDAEHADMSLAIEADVVTVLGKLRILGIRSDAEKSAVQVRGKLSLHLAVIEVDFRAIDASRLATPATEAPRVLGEEYLRLRRARRCQAGADGEARARYRGARQKAAPTQALARIAVVGITTHDEGSPG